MASRKSTELAPPQSGKLRKYSADEVRQDVLGSNILVGDTRHAIVQLRRLLPKYYNGTDADRKRVKRRVSKLSANVVYGYETRTHVALMEGFNERYRGGAKEMCEQIMSEYDCKTSLEIMAAEATVSAFMRYLDISRRLNSCIEVAEYISDDRTRYLAVLSKQIDRSHRQFLSVLTALKQLKAPPIEMNITTKNAFVAQNQQLNVGNTSHENIETK